MNTLKKPLFSYTVSLIFIISVFSLIITPVFSHEGDNFLPHNHEEDRDAKTLSAQERSREEEVSKNRQTILSLPSPSTPGEVRNRIEGRQPKDGRSATRTLDARRATATHMEMEREMDKKNLRATSSDERRGELRERLEEARKARIKAFFVRMLRRIEAALDRMDNLASRIETRIEKLEENNPNIQTDEAKEHIDEAKEHIASGVETLEGLPSSVEELISDNAERGRIFSLLRESVQDIITDIRNAHRSLVNAVRSIKASGGQDTEDENGKDEDPDDDDSATSTDETNDLQENATE